MLVHDYNPNTWVAESWESLRPGWSLSWGAEVGFSELRLCHCTPVWVTEQDSVSKNKKGINYWHTTRWMNLKTFCWAKEARHKRRYTVWYHSFETPEKTNQLPRIEDENWLGRSTRELLGWESQEMKMFYTMVMWYKNLSELHHFGRPGQVDHLRSGVWDQPGQYSETLSLLKI